MLLALQSLKTTSFSFKNLIDSSERLQPMTSQPISVDRDEQPKVKPDPASNLSQVRKWTFKITLPSTRERSMLKAINLINTD